MKHQEIVKLLREIDDYAKAGAGVPIRVWRCAGEVADAVEQMENEITRLREERRWIAVTERTPSRNVNVLIWIPSANERCIASLDEGGMWFSIDPTADAYSLGEDGAPTHWMPLPAPPKGGEVKE